MTRSTRWLATLLAMAMAIVGSPFSARAADEGWFDASASSPTTRPQSEAPAAPSGPEPLPPSPLLDDEKSRAPDPVDQSPEALTKWRPYLDPYGAWVDDPRYGRVWIPHAGTVGPGFQPYVSNGRWALDDDGEWIWVSDYPFGWVVFHYGRWVWIGGSGWAWVPGLRYAPAWVVWRVPTGSYAYVGWAPAPPSFVWFGGVAVHYHYGPYYPWVFCPSPYLFHYRVHYYVIRDPYWVGYAARHTRPYAPGYVPGSPRPRPAVRTAPSARRSPSFAAARVPEHAIPRERAPAAAQRDVRGFRDQRVESSRRDAGASPTRRGFDERRAAPRPEREVRPARPSTRRMLPNASPSRSRARPDVRATPGTRRDRR